MRHTWEIRGDVAARLGVFLLLVGSGLQALTELRTYTQEMKATGLNVLVETVLTDIIFRPRAILGLPATLRAAVQFGATLTRL